MKPQSIAHLFFEACDRFDKPDAVMVKQDGEYKKYSHRFFRQRVSHFGRGLIGLGLVEGDHVALLSETRLEWAVADLAIVSTGGVNVPIYATLTAEQVAWILNNSESKGIIVSTREQVDKIMSIRDEVPDLSFIIVMDGEAPEGVTTMDDVESRGSREDNESEFFSRWQTKKAEDLLTVIYTSGTTGNPKGVMLTHDNILSNIMSGKEFLTLEPTDLHLAHLPLCHVFERTCGYYSMLYQGVTIAYAEDIKSVPQNIMEVKPTILISVPRLYEKIYAKIMANATAGGFIKKKIFQWALSVGKQAAPYFSNGKKPEGFLGKKWNLADKLVFSKVKEKTGGRLRYLMSGGAPLAKEIAEFFLGMGLPTIEGYGLTETSPMLTFNSTKKIKPGTVGPQLPGVEVKIADDGEILARGPNVMKGYYKNPTATSEAIVDGWFHTGDIGLLDQDGYLRITDRKKDLIVTSGGKNIAPQPLENALKLSPLIEQAVIIGDKRNFIAALIVPPWETIEEWAPARHWPADPVKLANLAEFRQEVSKEIHNQMNGFAHYEKVKKFEIIPAPFTVETGELTPSLKVKRKVVNQHYEKVIDGIYQ